MAIITKQNRLIILETHLDMKIITNGKNNAFLFSYEDLNILTQWVESTKQFYKTHNLTDSDIEKANKQGELNVN
jgi:hypothetical protein